MNKYELVIIVDAQLPQPERDAISSQAQEIVVKSGGKVLSHKLWIEKHKPDFKIKKSEEVAYYLIEFEAGTSANASIKAALKLNEKVLRYLITRSNKQLV